MCIFNTMDCFGCNWKCIYRVKSDVAVPCIEHISTERVWNGVEISFALYNEAIMNKLNPTTVFKDLD
jgi:hypothetical protein